MISFMLKHKFVLSANFHSGSEVVNYPWDRYTTLHPDDSWFYSISRAYADTAHVYGGSSYMNMLDNGVTRGILWYKINGGRQDFTTADLHGREVTVELDNQYITPEEELVPLWQKNWHSLTGYLGNGLFGIHGLVLDSATHEPVPARVFISGHDKDSSHVYADTLTGNFVRYLSPGIWNLTFTAGNYHPVTINNVAVADRVKTEITVDMVRITGDKVINDAPLVIYPVPSKNHIKTLLPKEFSGLVKITISDQGGRIISDYEDEAVPGTPLDINIKAFSSGVYNIIFSNPATGTNMHGRFIVVN